MSAQEQLYPVVSEIISELGPILSTRPYVAIVDFKGEFKFVEAEFERYNEFITNFVKSNFGLLEIGDHSMPISGTNLAFFKISKKALIVIYIKKGLIGQLLVFKARMMNYQSKIDQFILETPSEVDIPTLTATPTTAAPQVAPPAEPVAPKAKIIPVLLKTIGKKDKFPLKEVVILNYCDGKNSINDIMREGTLEKHELWEILDKYKKKDWIKITYTGNPVLIPVLTKEIPAMAVQLGVVNKKEFEISKHCDGSNTINDIEEATGMPRDELEEILDKMEKNNIIHLEIKE